MSIYDSIGGTPALIGLFVGVVATYLISKYYSNRVKLEKRLGWTPLSITRIVRQRVADVAKGLALTWNGKPLGTPYTVKIRISNIGAREIIGRRLAEEHGRSDYEKPLIIKFEKSTCYECTVSDGFEIPIDTPLEVLLSPASEFEVPMPTLNTSSWIELEMIADGDIEFPRISCLLTGQTKPIGLVAPRSGSRVQSAALVAGGLGLFVLWLGFGLLGLFAYNPAGPGDGPPILMGAGATVAVVAGLVFTLSWVNARLEWNAIKRDFFGKEARLARN